MSVVQCLFVAFWTALFLRTGHCQEKPTITYVSQEQIQDLGSIAELVCKARNAQDYPVMWIKLNEVDPNNPMVISTNHALLLRDNRYSVRADPSTSTFTLRINDIQETDEGSYQCLIRMSASSKVTAEVELKLRRAPIIIFDNSTRSPLVVGENQSAQLECNADGYPKPQISWHRENNAKFPNGNSIVYGNVLRIDAAQKVHRGSYYCVAENGVGDRRGSRHNVILEVEFAPVIEANGPARSGQAQNYNVDLGCHVIAYPPPAITWYKDQEQLANNRHYYISHLSTEDEYNSTLRVVGIEKTQFGEYVCRAANKLGSAEAKVLLFETMTPV